MIYVLSVAVSFRDSMFRFWADACRYSGRGETYAVSRLPVTEEVRAPYLANVCGICGEQEWHLETGRS
jgi:hypothetical protein